MDGRVKRKADLLLRNRETITENLKWSEPRMTTSAALLYTAENREVDINRFMEADEYIEKNVGNMSEYHVKMRPVVDGRMAMADDPIRYFKDLDTVCQNLKKLSSTEVYYRMFAAMDIIDSERLYELETLITRYNEIFARMKKEHPFLTGMEDLIYTMRLTLSDKPVDDIIREMEQCYTYLRKTRKIKAGHDEVQGVSEILTLSNEDVSAKCEKVAALRETFDKHKAKYADYYNVTASLGVLINLDMDMDKMVEEIIELSEYLHPHPGFGELYMDKKLLTMFSAMLLYDAYTDDQQADVYASRMVGLHIVITQQVLLTKARRVEQSVSDDVMIMNMM